MKAMFTRRIETLAIMRRSSFRYRCTCQSHIARWTKRIPGTSVSEVKTWNVAQANVSFLVSDRAMDVLELLNTEIRVDY